MKRVIVVSASALALLAGPSVAAHAAQPSTPSAWDTATVCDVSGATVVKGLTDFMKELDKAGAAATSGDITASQTSVKQSGTMMIDLAGKLRKDVEHAQSAELKKAVEDVAKEMEIQGGNLSGDLSSVQQFNSKRIEDLSEKVNEICTR
jgi:soluble cytochrome b562